MHESLKYAEGEDAPRRRITIHSLLVFTASFTAVVLAAAALFDLLF